MPDFNFSDTKILKLSESYDDRPQNDFIEVGNEEVGANTPNATLTYDAENERLKVSVVPFQEIELRHSAVGDGVRFFYEGVKTEDVLKEFVEFSDGKASVSKPFYGLIEVKWIGISLGVLKIEEKGDVMAEIDGNALAEISYTTKYHLYKVTHDAGVKKVKVNAYELG